VAAVQPATALARRVRGVLGRRCAPSAVLHFEGLLQRARSSLASKTLLSSGAWNRTTIQGFKDRADASNEAQRSANKGRRTSDGASSEQSHPDRGPGAPEQFPDLDALFALGFVDDLDRLDALMSDDPRA
jgi:hypothetical protein